MQIQPLRLATLLRSVFAQVQSGFGGERLKVSAYLVCLGQHNLLVFKRQIIFSIKIARTRLFGTTVKERFCFEQKSFACLVIGLY